MAATFTAIEAASGAAAKTVLLRDLLERADPQTAKSIVKVIGGELRIGLREGLVEAAIAKAFERPLDDVKWAGMLTGDMGRLATLAHDDRLAEAELAVFHPLKFMLASPAEDAAEIVRRLGDEVWVEDKYDGIRAQLHKLGSDVRLYSRDLHDVSTQFPEVVEAARVLPWDGVLDGEVLGFKDGLVLPFISLQTRLGRKRPGAAVLADIPVIYVAFDALALGRRRGRAGRPDHGAAPARAPARAAGAAGRAGAADRALRAQPPGRGPLGGRARGGLRRRPRPAQRGPHGQGPGQRLLARAGAAWAG